MEICNSLQSQSTDEQLDKKTGNKKKNKEEQHFEKQKENNTMNLRLKAKMQTNSSIITKILDDNDRKDINKLTKIFKDIVSSKKKQKSDFFKENTKILLGYLNIIYEQMSSKLISALSFLKQKLVVESNH